MNVDLQSFTAVSELLFYCPALRRTTQQQTAYFLFMHSLETKLVDKSTLLFILEQPPVTNLEGV
jgi:hypothetical protein